MSCVKKMRGISNWRYKHDESRFGLGSTMALILMEAHEEMRGSGHAN